MRFALAVGLSLAIYLSLNDLGPKPVNAMSLAATQPGAQPLALRADDSAGAQAKKFLMDEKPPKKEHEESLDSTIVAHAAAPKMMMKRHHAMLDSAQHHVLGARGQHDGGAELSQPRNNGEEATVPRGEQSLSRDLAIPVARSEGGEAEAPQPRPQGKIQAALQRLMFVVNMLDKGTTGCPLNQSTTYRSCVPSKNVNNPPPQKCDVYTRCNNTPHALALADQANMTLTKIDAAVHEDGQADAHATKPGLQGHHGHTGLPTTDANVTSISTKSAISSIYEALSKFFAALHDAAEEASAPNEKKKKKTGVATHAHGHGGHGQHPSSHPNTHADGHHGHGKAPHVNYQAVASRGVETETHSPDGIEVARATNDKPEGIKDAPSKGHPRAAEVKPVEQQQGRLEGQANAYEAHA